MAGAFILLGVLRDDVISSITMAPIDNAMQIKYYKVKELHRANQRFRDQ